MRRPNDNVFQLSLTEIAFTLVFILLLLLGFLVFSEQSKRKSLEKQLAEITSRSQLAESAKQAAESLKAVLESAGAAEAGEIVSRFSAAQNVAQQREQLRREKEDLDAKISALNELKVALDGVPKSKREGVAEEKIESALALQEQVRKLISVSDRSGAQGRSEAQRATDDEDPIEYVRRAFETSKAVEEAFRDQLAASTPTGQSIKKVVDDARRFREMFKDGGAPEKVAKENADLRGQVAYLRNRLDARGGRDYPPCWANEQTGKVEFLFSVVLRESALELVPAWPPSREADARALPGIERALSESPHAYEQFEALIGPIFEMSRVAECRHYVQLRSEIQNAVESDRARLMVENYFYKLELRRSGE